MGMRWIAIAAGLLLCVGQAVAVEPPSAASAKFQYAALNIDFAQPMQTWEGDVDGIRFEPAISAAACHWASDVRLSCAFDAAHRPVAATRYRIRLPDGLAMQSGARLRALALSAETERPSVSANIRSWDAGRPRIVLDVVPSVEASALASVLRLTLAGRPVPVRLRREPGNGWRGDSYAMELPAQSVPDAALKLSIVPGLISKEGPLPGTQRRALLTAIVDESFRLRGGVCAGALRPVLREARAGDLAISCFPGETIRMFFSRSLDPASLRAWRAQWPKQAVFESSGKESSGGIAGMLRVAPGTWIELRVDASRSRLALPGLAALRSDAGQALPDSSIEIATVDRRPALSAPHRLNLLDPERLPAALAEATQASPVPLRMVGVGAQSRRESFASPEVGDPAAPILSPATRATLAEGGWAAWSFADDAARTSGFQLQFAAPDFDLFAVVAPRQVVAWANGWDGQAVAGAEVELLRMENATDAPRTVARGTTDAQGTALLALPDDFVVPKDLRQTGPYPQWLLRAQRGHGADAARAVLPFASNARYADLGEAPRRQFWGVSDRPMYRSGDTVRYRLWQRRDVAGRLASPGSASAAELILSTEMGLKTIRRWRADFSADGAVSGELALPEHLPDGTYCIGSKLDYEVQGVCFFVGTYRAQDLWVQAAMPAAVLRDGEPLKAGISAGYYSGGPAAGVPIVNLLAYVVPLRFGTQYPQFENFEFAYDARTEPPEVSGMEGNTLRTDAEGKASGEWPLVFDKTATDDEPPAFGRIHFSAEARPGDREGSVASAQAAVYARFDRYVGLRVEPDWLGANGPVTLQAVVADAHGREDRSADIEVEIGYQPYSAEDSTEIVHRCRLQARRSQRCDFVRARSGIYRFTARSGAAAPVSVDRYVWVAGDDDDSETEDEPELLQVGSPGAPGEPLRVLLTQGDERAQALFVFAAGRNILARRAMPIASRSQQIDLETDPGWPASFELKAYVRVANEPGADGMRMPSDFAELELDVKRERAPVSSGVSVSVDAAARPGGRVEIVLRNRSREPRDVALAVVDDALISLAGEQWDAFDPVRSGWLTRSDYGSLYAEDFGDWNDAPWRRWLSWGKRAMPMPECESAAAASPECATRAAGGIPTLGAVVVQDEARINPIDISSVESTTILTAEQFANVRLSRGGTEVALLAPGTVRSAPAPDSNSLDTVTVVGSGAIVPPVPNGGGPPTERERSAGSRDAMASAWARVRQRFADTALWRPDLRLAPGETRRIALDLPDNLTRWRAVAWVNDADDVFERVEASVQAGLPVEVRLQSPVRLYPGDSARLAANVRQTGDAANTAQVALDVDGEALGPTPFAHRQSLPLSARGQASFGAAIAPVAVGPLLAVARAQTTAGSDAVAAAIDVASPLIDAGKIQAGWLDAEPVSLNLPALPEGATDAQLRVSLLRGDAGFVERWSADLRDYPHRCWEQILSRAVGAALALQRRDPAWPDAPAAVAEALDNAAVFQSEEGGFRFFVESGMEGYGVYASTPKPDIALTAYSLRALAQLRSLGHAVDPEVEARARSFLERALKTRSGAHADPEHAYAMTALTPDSMPAALRVWSDWKRLPIGARIAAAHALADARRPEAATAVERLWQAAHVQGRARLMTDQTASRWMSSPLREQCAMLDLLREHPDLAPAGAVRALRSGLLDLYAGGVGATDTQSASICLMALRAGAADAGETLDAEIALGSQHASLSLAPGQQRTDWEIPAPSEKTLRLSAPRSGDSPAAFVARLEYREDARRADQTAVGLRIARRIEVLRGDGWAPVGDAPVRQGDWLRITLTVDNAAPRYFVAVSDSVAGGLQPTDLSLKGVAGLALERLSGLGSAAFDTRKLDPTAPRFYAESLPAGRHEIHYFARAGNAGDYLAAPATAELMYGEASRARTAALRLRIEEAMP